MHPATEIHRQQQIQREANITVDRVAIRVHFRRPKCCYLCSRDLRLDTYNTLAQRHFYAALRMHPFESKTNSNQKN